MTFISIGVGVPDFDRQLIMYYCRGFIDSGKKSAKINCKNNLKEPIRLIFSRKSDSTLLVNYYNIAQNNKRMIAIGQEVEILKLIKGYKLPDK